MRIGYIRVSSYEQNTDRQLEGVKVDNIYVDTVSGKNMERPGLRACLLSLKDGDTLYVHSIDRLTRNLQDLLALLSELLDRNITIVFCKEKLTFSNESSSFQRLHLQIIGAVAEFERAFIRERQREGIAISKKNGKYKGRKAILTKAQIEDIYRRMKRREGVASLAKEYGVSRQTIYRNVKNRCRGDVDFRRESSVSRA